MDQAAGADSPHLEQDEQDQAAAHSAPRALVIHEIVRAEGEEALSRTASALLWSGLAAGLSMGFSFLVEALIASRLPDTPIRHLFESFGYCIGFLIVILGRQQLFTESTLTVVLPVLTRRTVEAAGALLRLWGIVLAANIAGTWVFAWLLTAPGVFRPEVVEALATLARAPTEGTFPVTLVRAVFAGWLVATMVWLLPSARYARFFVVVLITFVVALGGLAHVIAGSVEAGYAVLTGASTIGAYAWRFLVPTLLGNTLGGVAFVALLNHAAIAPEIRPE
ncbi:formate/nitrite transporter family protein [Acidisphaera rubrifaciens]|uniref:Formate/nitrite transporter n=1 Tax=Acidisphaera rubrifaciens HS-AP3 TaxID=1231350 RepID=A0A0D6P8B3_9PROT|nr:formate/nitrite transporter family protein [Acidisphaera rubrifaciens]GAN78010.1 formate/nitrite transporter [Acidisphaera rubrifaciens HS-AP3]